MSTIYSTPAGYFIGGAGRESYYFDDPVTAATVQRVWERTTTRPYALGSSFMTADGRIHNEHAVVTGRDLAFLQFHADNPEVWDFLVGRLQVIWRPGLRVGLYLLINQLRWRSYVRAKRYDTDVEEYKINDHYESRYARLIMAEMPALGPVFETRRLTT